MWGLLLTRSAFVLASITEILRLRLWCGNLLSSRCVGVGAGWGRAGEQVMVGQVGRRAFWHIKCTVGKSGAVGVANCFPPNASGRAWWGVGGVVGRGWGGGAGWGVLARNIAPCQSSTHSHTSTLSRPAQRQQKNQEKNSSP